MASKNIRSDMVEVSEFPHLAVKYSVQGVPKTVINEKEGFVGAGSEMEAARRVLEVIKR